MPLCMSAQFYFQLYLLPLYPSPLHIPSRKVHLLSFSYTFIFLKNEEYFLGSIEEYFF